MTINLIIILKLSGIIILKLSSAAGGKRGRGERGREELVREELGEEEVNFEIELGLSEIGMRLR